MRGFRSNAIEYCLAAANCKLDEVDFVAFYDKPFLKFERLLETYLAFAPRRLSVIPHGGPPVAQGKAISKATAARRTQEHSLPILIGRIGCCSASTTKVMRHRHFLRRLLRRPSCSRWMASANGPRHQRLLDAATSCKMTKEIYFPHSLGLLYSALTYYTGFKVNSGEYKVMGLAPYGEPTYAKTILDHLIDLKPDGSFRLNLDYFNYCTGLTMTNERFDALFGGPPRRPEQLLEQRHMNLAASIQAVLEEIVLRLTRSLAQETGIPNLAMAGGVALNCVANGKVLRDGKFKNIWIQPAAGDAGGALGVALAAYHIYQGSTAQD